MSALDDATVQALASALDEAEQSRTQLGHFSKRFPALGVADAYRIQKAWMTAKRARGRQVRGHKIGLTSRAMQRSSNIGEPDYGVLLDDMFFVESHDIPFSRFIVPRVEVELAFVLGKRLSGPRCSIFDVLAATEYVVPAIEIIDARIEQRDPSGSARTVVDTISDNAANAGVVLGGRPFAPDSVDLRWISAILYRDGVIEESGVAAAVLNHPAHGPAWLANKLHLHGESLEPGEIILGGSFTAPVPAAAGNVFHADYGRHGSIAFRFAP